MDLSHCYLHSLGEAESAKLEQLRSKLPEIVNQVKEESQEAAALNDLTIWRVKVTEKSDASDIVLLKYLRAEELDVDKAAERLKSTFVFRADCRIDELAEAELPEQFQGHDFITGSDADGRPIMISRFGSMDIDKVFGDTEAFVRYRAKLMEQAIQLLAFKKGTAEDLCQVHDYSGVMSSMYKSEVKAGVSAISKVFSEHYPEFKGKTLFVNFPAVFSKPFKAFSALLPERTRKKFIILGTEDHQILFEHLAPHMVPEAIGGMSRTPPGPLDGECRVVQVGVRKTDTIEMFAATGPCSIAWDLRVCSREVAYEVTFVPADAPDTPTVVQASEKGQYLKAEDGIISGTFESKSAGSLKCSFSNECAWFKARRCCCRAGLV